MDDRDEGRPDPDDGPIGVGTRCEADVRIFGITVTDPVTITEFEPPMRYAISHDGTFKGSGVITLESGADGTTTIVALGRAAQSRRCSPTSARW